MSSAKKGKVDLHLNHCHRLLRLITTSKASFFKFKSYAPFISPSSNLCCLSYCTQAASENTVYITFLFLKHFFSHWFLPSTLCSSVCCSTFIFLVYIYFGSERLNCKNIFLKHLRSNLLAPFCMDDCPRSVRVLEVKENRNVP